MIGAEDIAQRGLTEPAGRVLAEDSDTRQGAEEATQERAVSVRRLRKFPNGLRSSREEIGDTELRRNMDCLHGHCSRPQNSHQFHERRASGG